ncbi:MAG: hypothetical protein ACK46D_17345, partial [Roseiflexaceae bacterium]
RRVYRELPTAAGILEDAKEGRKSDGPVVAIHDYRHLTNGELLLAAGTLLNGSDAQKMLLNAAATFFTGQRLREDVVNPKTGKTIGEAGQDITAKMAAEIAALPLRVV